MNEENKKTEVTENKKEVSFHRISMILFNSRSGL